MNPKALFLAVCLAGSVFAAEPIAQAESLRRLPRPQTGVLEVEARRQTRLVSEDEFLRLAREPGTVILDARSAEKFKQLHIKGAVNLSFPDFTEETLARAIPTKTTRVLIYCNNNFKDSPGAFPAKRIEIALNLSTYVALHVYGYENVYELAPLLEVKTTRLPLAGRDAG